MIRPCFVLLLVSLLPIAAPGQSRPDGAMTQAWELASRMDYAAAVRIFRAETERPGAEVRSARFGLALATLNLPPTTPQRVAETERWLREVRDGAPDDDLGVQAAYFLARIAALHRTPREPGEAREAFLDLAARVPAHRVGQLALLEAGMIDLYDLESADGAAVRLARWTERFTALTHPTIERAAWTVLADAFLRLTGGDEAESTAVELYGRAAALDIRRADYAAMVLFRIAHYGERTGQYRMAIAALERWERDHASRGWNLMVEEWLGKLRAAAEAQAAQP